MCYQNHAAWEGIIGNLMASNDGGNRENHAWLMEISSLAISTYDHFLDHILGGSAGSLDLVHTIDDPLCM